MMREKIAAAEARRAEVQRLRQAVTLRIVEGDPRAPGEMKSLDRQLAEVDGELSTLRMASSAAVERARAEEAAAEAARLAAARNKLADLVAARMQGLAELCSAVAGFEEALARVAEGVGQISATIRELGLSDRGASCLQGREFEHRLSLLLRTRLGRFEGLGVRRAIMSRVVV